MHFCLTSTHVGFMLDTFVSATTTFTLFCYLFSLFGSTISDNYAPGLAVGCLFTLVNLGNCLSQESIIVLIIFGFICLPFVRFQSDTEFFSKPVIFFNLLKNATVNISLNVIYNVVNMAYITLQFISKTASVSVSLVHSVKKLTFQNPIIAGSTFLSKIQNNKFSAKDIKNVDDDSFEYIKNYYKKPIDNTKCFFVAQFLIMSEWKTVLAIVIGKSLVRIAKRWRQLVFVSIMAAFRPSSTKSTTDIFILITIWQLLAVSEFINLYIISVINLVQKRMEILITIKRLNSINWDKNCNNSSSREFIDYTQRLLLLLDSFSLIIAELFNVWIIAKRVGWYFAIPILVTSMQMCISYIVENKNEKTITHNNLKDEPKFYKNYHTAISALRAIKLYSWENLFLDNTTPYLCFKTGLPVFRRIINIFVDILSSSVTQISTAVTLVLYLQASESVITYSDLLLLMDSTNSLTGFTLKIIRKIKELELFKTQNKSIEFIFRDHEFEYITGKPLTDLNKNIMHLDECQFSWGPTKFKLQAIKLSINQGDFVTVIGKIGSGKTSLLEALAGEMPLTSGTGCVYGRVAYVCQKPYILQKTIRENILMGAEYNSSLYKQVIKACALDQDIEQFASGDSTRIGPNGINLSGGQKVRLALARALYMQADIYFFDDVLSAVDAQVERHLVECVLSSSGIIGNKTRILVTHSEHVVPLSNMVIKMDNGCATTIKQTPVRLSIIASDFTNGQSIYVEAKEKCKNDTAEEKPNIDKYIIRPEESIKGVELKHISWFISNSGYLAILIMVFIKIANSFALYRVESWRFNLILDNNPSTMMASFKWYLIVNAVLKIVKIQIGHIEEWLCQKYWTEAVSTKLFNKFISLILNLPLPLSERLSEAKLKSIVACINYKLTNRVPMLIYNGIYTNLIIIVKSVAQITSLSPILLFPTVLFYTILYLWKYNYLKADKKFKQLGKYVEFNTDNIYYHMLSSQKHFLRVNGLTDTFIEKLAFEGIAVCKYQSVYKSVSTTDSMITSLFAEIVNTIVLLFSIQRFTGRKTWIRPNSVRFATSIINRTVVRAKYLSSEIQSLRYYGKVLTDVYTYAEGLNCESELLIGNHKPDPSWPQNGSIEFINYKMRYRPELETVLKDLNFSVKCNEKVGIVGRTGAGKSSITFALMRIVEAESGFIKIDGLDISTVNVYELRSKIAIIPQDPVLFEGTVRDNLDPECKHTDNEIWTAINACQFAHILETPTAKFKYDPNNKAMGPWVEGTGLNKWIQRNGTNFSVGQRQLLSLCRALLWKRKIVILDEATANINNETDRIMQTVIRHEFNDYTVLTIAHRLNTVMDSDRILVMDNGQAVEFDTPINLLANENGHFTKLVNSMKLNHEI